MPDSGMPANEPQLQSLRNEIARLNKIVTALMDRAESSVSLQGGDFGLFQTTVMLEEQVRNRTEELRRRQDRLELVLEASNTGMWQWDVAARSIGFSSTYYTMLGYPPGEASASQENWSAMVHPEDWPRIYEILRGAVHASHDEPFGFEFRMRDHAGHWRWLHGRGRVTERDADGRARWVVGVNNDISERKWSEAHERLRGNILEQLARGFKLPEVLNALVRDVEAELPGCVASILLVDEDGRLRHGAAPNLPVAYTAALDGLPIGDGVGSCGTAAYRGELVIVEDIAHHPYWEGYRELAISAGLAACWSQPVIDMHGRVIATFAIYTREPGAPDPRDLANLVHAANLASIAISHHHHERRLQMAMQALATTQESVYWIDEYGRILYTNAAAEQALGFSGEEFRRMTMSDINPTMPTHLWGPDGEMERRCRSGGLRGFQSVHRHRGGQLIPIEINATSFIFDGKRYSMSIVHDIRDRLAAEQALRRSEAKFAAIFSLTPDPMALMRLADGTMLEVSRSFVEFFGYRPEEVLGRSAFAASTRLWVDPDEQRQWRERVEREGETRGFETALRRHDGSTITVQISGKLVEIGSERCVIVAIHDISEQKEHAARLEQMAHHDPLTGLPNRLLLRDRLHQAIAHNQRAGTRIAVCYLDLDGFKHINDRFGHQAGDQLLIEVAKRLTADLRSSDTVARLGGDEFVIVLSGLADETECWVALRRILATVSAPYAVDGSEQSGISASLGVTLYPDDRVDPDTLVRHADHAMYVAKQAGKNRYQLFDTNLEQRIEARHATLRSLACALDSHEFRLHYQPKVDCRHGRIVGAEALLRWQHPRLGLLSPAEFIPLIEDAELADPIGEWVIGEALAQVVTWRREGIALRVSVNVFIRQLLQPGFAASLATILARFPTAGAECLQIEIVETAALKDIDVIRQVIEDCAELGVSFSLDDFGTGYSTLAHLRHLPVSEIKVDQSFVRNMLTRTEDLAIVEAVIGMARAFGRSVVAEGVETTEHVERLLALGCDIMQGYALARPMPPDEFSRWVHAFHPNPSWLGVAGDTSQS